MTYREIESKVFQDVFETFRSNNIDVKENISQLAKLVKDQSTHHYSKQKRIQNSMMESYSSPTSKDNNKDLKILKPLAKSFINFDLQSERPDINKITKIDVHEHRFKYFDQSKVTICTKYSKEKNFDFDKMLSRTNVFKPQHLGPLTPNDQSALSQSINHGKSHLNDLPSDHKDYFKKKLRDRSINFDN